MSTLIDRKEQAVSVTDMVRSAKGYLDNLKNGIQDRYVIIRNNSPEAVLVSVERFEDLMDELANLRIESVAHSRMEAFDPSKAISHEDLLNEFRAGTKNENLGSDIP